MTLQELVEQTTQGLGYELIDIERSAGGLLRIVIDWPWQGASVEAAVGHRAITVDDCERVTRQLQYALEVANIDYKRLEVTSPGIDRPLRTELDFERFVGHEIDVALKTPIGLGAAGSDGSVHANRKRFHGTLERGEQPGQWRLVWRDEPVVKPGQRVSKKRQPAPLQAMDFLVDELREARLAPVVNFKGRSVAADELPTPE